MIALLCSGMLWHSTPWNRSGLERPIEAVREARITIGAQDASFVSGSTHFEGRIFDRNETGTPRWWNTSNDGLYEGLTGYIYYFGAKPLADLPLGESASFGANAETLAGFGDHGDEAFNTGNYFELSCSRSE